MTKTTTDLYKQTALGLIPSDWDTKKLENVINEMTDYVAAGSFESLRNNVNVLDGSGFAYYVRLTDLRLGLGHQEQKYVDEKSYVFLRKSNLFGNEILMANIGANVGETWLMPFTNQPATIAPNMIVIKPDIKKVVPEFLFYYTHSPIGFSKLEELIAGSGHPKINKGELKKLLIPLPPLPEQKAIAHVLSKADAAIQTTEKLIAQKELRKKWLMQQLLSGKKRLKGFGGEWKEKKLSELFDRVTRKNTEGNTTVVTISAQRGFVRQTDFFNKNIASEVTDNYFLVEKGEFCYNKSYSNGYPWGATKRLNDFEKAVVTTLYICFGIKDITKTNTDFFEQYFNANLLDKGLTKIAHEGGRAHGLLNVTPTDFFSLNVSIPSIEEQTAIAQVLQAADKEINLLKTKATKLREQKKGLMQQLLTGKKRLNQNFRD